jgi:cytochrome c oxidase cbb3-type subunit IV
MVSGIVTAILLASFVGGCAWAWSSRRRGEFDQASRLPLEEPPTLAREASAAAVGEFPRTEGRS